ncbi:MAG: DUF3795 domain-containing protein [Planctomycetaceae bacterium]|nr:DUF3795 domain-containing protein [Planctomycetaceae bacterium]
MKFDPKMLAYCGIYCEQCSARVAFTERDWKHLEMFPSRFTAGRPDLSEYDCEGCKGRNLCGPCGIKDCASGRNLDSCADCGEFPCAMLVAFETDGIPHHRWAVDNLRRIRAHGLEAWFAAFRPALRCDCGQRQSWYHTCPVHTDTLQKEE